MPTRPFYKVLVANRGEIAIRVLRAASELELHTVAIYTREDRYSLHRYKADESYEIGAPDEPLKPYLDIEAIIACAKQCGAQAIHPGYGFLSESLELATRCREEDIVFVGPSPEAMAQMGDKRMTKELARKCDVPVIEDSKELITDFAVAKTEAARIGYPIMVKASSGGGGRGMRVVHSADELEQSISMTQSEAELAFNNSTVYMEKFLTSPRHIEFQVIADTHGNAIHLAERDCSLQRRHQKIVEEAPAPGIDEKTRQDMGKRCTDACKRIGYRGAGTFEFLYENGGFYFIEMNTRVQVEHPVTEMITGVDIIKQQIKVAEGHELAYKQEDIVVNGHAFECRINAEDPNTFMPSPGTITQYHAPGGLGVRMDTHIYNGYKVPPNYDSMIAKLIVKGMTRETAMSRMRGALSEVFIDGIVTNIPLHNDIFLDEGFLEGGVDIHYLEHKLGLQ